MLYLLVLVVLLVVVWLEEPPKRGKKPPHDSLWAVLLVATLALSGRAHAQTFGDVRKVINEAGHRCDRVENVRAAGQTESRDALLVIDCSDGSSHVVRVTPKREVLYFAKCGFLNPVRCD